MILKNGVRIDGCSDTVPIGTLNPYIGTTAPFGYLICEGQLVDKATYPELYAICGNTFGTATSTQFYLPDLRGQTIAGYKSGDSDFGTLGGLIGSKYLQEHYHDIRWASPTGSGVTITGSGSETVLDITSFAWDHNGMGLKGSGSNLYTSSEGTGNAGNIQPTMVLNWIVKAIMLMPNQSTVSTVETNSDINTYSCNYINEINQVKPIIRVTNLNGDNTQTYNISTAYTNYPITMVKCGGINDTDNFEVDTTNNRLYIRNPKIKTIRLSAQIAGGRGTVGNVYLNIRKNGVAFVENRTYLSADWYAFSLYITPTLVSVEENDYLDWQFSAQATGDHFQLSRGYFDNFMEVEVVEWTS